MVLVVFIFFHYLLTSSIKSPVLLERRSSAHCGLAVLVLVFYTASSRQFAELLPPCGDNKKLKRTLFNYLEYIYQGKRIPGILCGFHITHSGKFILMRLIPLVGTEVGATSAVMVCQPLRILFQFL